MNIKIQVIDTNTGISNYGSIEEPNIQKGLEIDHALRTFGITYATVKWIRNDKLVLSTVMTGTVEKTSKVVIVVVLEGKS